MDKSIEFFNLTKFFDFFKFFNVQLYVSLPITPFSSATSTNASKFSDRLAIFSIKVNNLAILIKTLNELLIEIGKVKKYLNVLY